MQKRSPLHWYVMQNCKMEIYIHFIPECPCIGRNLPLSLGSCQVASEFNIKGSAVGNQREALEVLDMAARGIVKTHLRVEKMEKLTEVFQEMSAGKMKGRVVLDLQ